MTEKIKDQDVSLIRRALDDARNGRATLKQLAHAHDVAEDAQLSGTVGELREHIRRMTPTPPLRTEAKSVALGVLSGCITWLILGMRRNAR